MTDLMPTRHRDQSGLTLVELLVAILIASVVSVAGIGLTRQTLAASATADDMISAINDLAVARSLIEADLVSLAGYDLTLDGSGVGFRRIADTLPDSEPIPPVAVTYTVENGALVRRTGDGGARALLPVDEFTAEVLGPAGWTGDWPQQGLGNRLPVAMALITTGARWGEMTLKFPISLAVGPR